VARLFIFALPVILTIYGLIDCVLTPESEMRWLPKVAWVVAILLLPGLGAGVWLIWGREDSAGPRAWGITRPGGFSGPQRPRRPTAPDDDPEFLRQLRNSDREHEQVLRQWERELRRREGGPPGARNADADKQSLDDAPAAQPPPQPPASSGPAAPGPDAAQDAPPEDPGQPPPEAPETERPDWPERPSDDGR
jgi:hypothetical protein